MASAARITLHLELQAGTNAHHMIEACFKAFARALRVAVSDRPGRGRRALDEGDADVTVALVDYGMGNRRSVEKALEHVGAARRAHGRPRGDRAPPTAIVVPGVGAFPEAMRRLRALGLDELLRERAAAGVPLLGICLGMQLLFESSTEHEGAAGLGLLGGHRHAARGAGAEDPAHRLEHRHVHAPGAR